MQMISDLVIYYDPWLVNCCGIYSSTTEQTYSQDERDNYYGLSEEEVEMMEWEGE